MIPEQDRSPAPTGPTRPFTVIVLAGQREGRRDPLAENAGVSHKALVPIAGKPLLAHVLEALSTIPNLGQVNISVEENAADALRSLGDFGLNIDFVPAADNLADSIRAASAGVEGPIVVTTADNVLVRREPVEETVALLERGAEAVVALAAREAVLAAHPEGQRRFYRFSDASYSNCNLYGLCGPNALKAAEAFRSGGQFVKNPKRIAAAVGLLNVLRFRLGLVSMPAAMRKLSKVFGVRIEPLVLRDGSYAIDVDNERTFAIANILLEKRAAQGH